MQKIVALIVPVMLLVVSCTDPCDDVNCLNGGACNDGTCICPEGFEGEFCETSIQTDPCEDVVCFNGGVCLNGLCECPSGFTGDSCQTSTQVNPCDTITCQNNGVCVDGDCICPDGYTGTLCEIVERDQYLDGFHVLEECNPGTYEYDINISPGSDITEIVVSNFGGYGVTVTCVVDGNSINIPQQSNAIGGFSGNGSISGDVLTINYTANIGLGSVNCVKVCTRD